MIRAILNLLPILLGAVCTAFWIFALSDWDGECHGESCDHCPYYGDCPMERGEEDVSEKEN